jgi:hypothetical protein
LPDPSSIDEAGGCDDSGDRGDGNVGRIVVQQLLYAGAGVRAPTCDHAADFYPKSSGLKSSGL